MINVEYIKTMEYECFMKRMLCIVASMDAGGAETFLMKIYRNIDRKNYQIDFLVSSNSIGFYDEEIRELGGNIYYTPPKSSRMLAYIVNTYSILKEGKYDAVLRMTAHSLGTIDLLIAKIAGTKQLVLRSTNTDVVGGKFSLLLHKLFWFLPRWVPNVKLAPSTLAAEHLFGKGCVEKGEVNILKNAIPTEKYIFSLKLRQDKRAELGIINKFVVGHIGRFNKQKNHKFLLEVFSKICKANPNAVLLLVGKGELEDNINNIAVDLNISDKVIFAGVRSDIPEIMMAMDIMLFPSFFEGMPNVIIEAQATGLPCLISDHITKDAKILDDLVTFIPIDESVKKDWVNRVTSLVFSNRTDATMQSFFIEAGYDINVVKEEFIKFVFKEQVLGK